MNSPKDLLQERLVRLEAGESLAACLEGLGEDDAVLLRKAAQLRSIPKPILDRGAVERRALIQSAKERKKMDSSSTPQKQRPAWILPVAIAGGVFVLLACVTVVALLAGIFMLRTRTSSPQVVQPAPVEILETATPLTSSEPATPVPPVVEKPTEAPTESVASPTTAPQVVAAVVEPPDALTAVLSGLRGLVQVQDLNGGWVAAEAGMFLKTGQSLRTGALSSATLLFYDGSQVTLGAEAELQLAAVDAQREGPRTIKLNQKVGESDHQVAKSTDSASIYEVVTPDGTGTAMGTRFRVDVLKTRLVRFDVFEGAVVVVKQDTTLKIVAGQSTIIIPSAPPNEPLYRITGQGKVDKTDTRWHIGGDIFMVTGHTQVIGDPQVGDWVSFEALIFPDGSRLLTRVLLLRHASENRFTFSGKVEAIAATQWTVAGRLILTGSSPDIDPGIQVNSPVEVEGSITDEGALRAERIRLLSDQAGLPFEFSGIATVISDTSWLVSGIAVTVDASTTLDADIALNDIVDVRGWILDGNVWLAHVIRRSSPGAHLFEIVGVVKSLSPWAVSEIALATDALTESDPLIKVGDQVRVEGLVMDDGSWLAQSIQPLQAPEAQAFQYFGLVTSLSPWMVNNIPLSLSATAEVSTGILVGDKVWVQGVILSDGTWQVDQVQRLVRNLGCVIETTVITGQDDDNFEVLDWHRGKIKKHNDLLIIGEVKETTIVSLTGCTLADKTFFVTQISAVYQLNYMPDIIKPAAQP